MQNTAFCPNIFFPPRPYSKTEVLTVKKERWILLCIFTALLMLTVGSRAALDGAAKGVELVLWRVLPSALPFMILANLTGRYAGRQLLPALLTGNLAGYPAGASLCVRLADGFSETDTFLLLTACVGMGPGFTIGTIGTAIFQRPSVGVILFASQLLTSLTAAVPLLLRRRGHASLPSECHPFAVSLTEAIKESSRSMLSVGGTIVFFSCLLSAAADRFGFPRGRLGMTLAGLLEISNGCARATPSFGESGIVLLGFLLGFGGVSVLCQLLAITQESGIPAKTVLLSRLFASLLGGGYTFLLCRLFPAALESATFSPATDFAAFHPFPLAFTLCLLVLSLLLCDRRTLTARISP